MAKQALIINNGCATTSINDNKETILVVLLYCFVAVSSLINLGFIAAPSFFVLLLACSLHKPRTGFVALVAIFYLPMAGLHIPNVFIIATIIVGVVNVFKIKGKNWLRINKDIVILYSLFLFFRFISVVFVPNINAFWNHFFISFTVLVHILIITFLIRDEGDVMPVLRIWGYIGAAAAVLGFLHYLLQDAAYLRQINYGTEIIDKSAIDGSYDSVRWLWFGVEPNFHGLSLLIPFTINLSFLFRKVNLPNILLTILTYLGILGTFSRTSFLVSTLIVVLFLIYSPNRKGKNKVFDSLVFIIIVYGVYLAVSTFFPAFTERIESIQEAATMNNVSGRTPLYLEAINNFIHNPFLGVGTGQTAYYSIYKLESHNLFLQTLGENGIFGFAVLFALFLVFVRRASFVKNKNPLFFFAIIAIMINANTVSYFDMRLIFSLFVLLNYYYFGSRKINKNVTI